MERKGSTQGFSLVEALITIAIFGLMFSGLFLAVEFTITLIRNTSERSGALALANERVEYVRSLPYESVGTESGVPHGVLKETSTTTLNGRLYHERLLVQYIDAPEDGIGTEDENGILEDYKQVRVEYTWQGSNGTSSLFLLTDVMPKGIESVGGGGTIKVNVFDANVAPIQGASVEFANETVSPPIRTTRYTNNDGIAYLSGAPAASDYSIIVSKPGFSIDRTYTASSLNPNPTTPNVSVLQGAISTMNFQIDRQSSLKLRSVGSRIVGTWADDFEDDSKLASTSGTQIVNGIAVLAGGPSSFEHSGTIFSVPVMPSGEGGWLDASWKGASPSSTSLRVRVYYVHEGISELIPESVLPGNASGFDISPISLAHLSPDIYSELALQAVFTSESSGTSSRLFDWNITSIMSQSTIANVPFMITSAKVIGTTATASPVYKYRESVITNGIGELSLSQMEWGFYSIDLTTSEYDIEEACGRVPHTVKPGSYDTLTLALVSASPVSLRVDVVNDAGVSLPGARVTLSRVGYESSLTTSSCGQVFFREGLAQSNDYVLTVSTPGYQNQTVTNIAVGPRESIAVTLQR